MVNIEIPSNNMKEFEVVLIKLRMTKPEHIAKLHLALAKCAKDGESHQTVEENYQKTYDLRRTFELNSTVDEIFPK
jgi:hypothetical protein